MPKKDLRSRQRQQSADSKNRVRDSRVELGLTKVELAKLASVSAKTVDRVERGEHAFRETTYRKIFNALNKVRARETMILLVYTDLFPAERAGEEKE